MFSFCKPENLNKLETWICPFDHSYKEVYAWVFIYTQEHQIIATLRQRWNDVVGILRLFVIAATSEAVPSDMCTQRRSSLGASFWIAKDAISSCGQRNRRLWQTARVRRLVSAFVRHTCQKVCFLMSLLIQKIVTVLLGRLKWVILWICT